MSVSTYQNNVNRLRQQIADLNKKQVAEKKKQIDLRVKINDLTKHALSASNLSTAQSYQRQAISKEKDLNRVEGNISSIEKQIVLKEKELSRNQENLTKALEQQEKKRREQEKSHLKEKELFNRQELSHVRSMNDEFEKQQRLFSAFSDAPNDSLNNDTEFNIQELVDLNQRIDAVLDKLEKLGMGQEILFDEIESLKGKSKKISKKDLSLILIGQLVSFGAGKLDSEALKMIYENITNIDISKMIK